MRDSLRDEAYKLFSHEDGDRSNLYIRLLSRLWRMDIVEFRKVLGLMWMCFPLIAPYVPRGDVLSYRHFRGVCKVLPLPSYEEGDFSLEMCERMTKAAEKVYESLQVRDSVILEDMWCQSTLTNIGHLRRIRTFFPFVCVRVVDGTEAALKLSEEIITETFTSIFGGQYCHTFSRAGMFVHEAEEVWWRVLWRCTFLVRDVTIVDEGSDGCEGTIQHKMNIRELFPPFATSNEGAGGGEREFNEYVELSEPYTGERGGFL